MAKAPPKLFKIGEVMEHTGLSRQTLHNYTMLGLIRSKSRTRSGHRLYDEDVFDVVERIKLLKEKRHTLDDIRRILGQEAAAAPVKD
ncbi:MAG TPA: MerR family transcriptional regulator [Planctomycetota bacterium]|nr:MerR family transcriptional regulator [Planctomycetota bacterium]